MNLAPPILRSHNRITSRRLVSEVYSADDLNSRNLVLDALSISETIQELHDAGLADVQDRLATHVCVNKGIGRMLHVQLKIRVDNIFVLIFHFMGQPVLEVLQDQGEEEEDINNTNDA